jgi:hypothetical protein
VFSETTTQAFQQSCFSGTASCPILFLRPSIAWHGQRTTDAMTAIFLSVEPVLARGFFASSPYAYAMNEPTRNFDSTGEFTISNCDYETSFVRSSVIEAASKISACDFAGSDCIPYDSSLQKVKMQLIFQILFSDYVCAPSGLVDGYDDAGIPVYQCGSTAATPSGMQKNPIVLYPQSFVPFPGSGDCSVEYGKCLPNTVAHEAAHHLGLPDDTGDGLSADALADICVPCL